MSQGTGSDGKYYLKVRNYNELKRVMRQIGI